MTKTPQETVKALLESGLTQVHISSKTSIPQPTLSRILNGATQYPRWDHAMRLSSLLNEVMSNKARCYTQPQGEA
jgi:predicted transcriptional regulator